MSAGLERGWDSGNGSGGKGQGEGCPAHPWGCPPRSGGAWKVKERDGGGSPPGL